MTNEVVALEDEETETSVLDFLANQSETAENEAEVDTEDDSDDVEVLKERILKRNSRLRKSKESAKRIDEENDILRKTIDELEGKLSKPTSEETGAKNQEHTEALDRWRTEISDNPEKAVDFSNWQMSQLQESLVGVVSGMNERFEKQIAELRGETNPERIKYKDQMDKLRASNPDFAGLDDTTMMAVVKATSGVKIPRGGIGGQKATRQPSAEDKLVELTKRFDEFNANGQ